MKLLFVIPGSGTGASMIFARRQAEALRHVGISVRAIHLHTQRNPCALWQTLTRLRREIRDAAPDVVHVQYGSLIGALSGILAGEIPTVVTFRGGDLQGGPVRWALSQIAAIRSARTICVSQALERRLPKRSRTLVLPSGVDRSVFRAEPRDLARRRLGWRLDERVVVFNAGFDPINKGLDLAERAVELARASLPGLRLHTLQGDTNPSSIPDLLNASDCLLITSAREGSPCILQEALSCELPVVSVDVGDCAERLAGVPNTVLTTREPEALAGGIVELVRESRRSSADTTELGFDRLAERLKRLYEEICERSTSRC